MKNYILLGMVGLVLVLVIFQSFQINGLKNDKVTGDAVAVSSGVPDMTGWTEDEKMMYDHHGTMPARLQGGASPSSGMVGGC